MRTVNLVTAEDLGKQTGAIQLQKSQKPYPSQDDNTPEDVAAAASGTGEGRQARGSTKDEMGLYEQIDVGMETNKKPGK
jgi:hypothetical protein